MGLGSHFEGSVSTKQLRGYGGAGEGVSPPHLGCGHGSPAHWVAVLGSEKFIVTQSKFDRVQ